MSTQAGIWNFDGVPAGEDLLRKLVRVMPTVSPDGEYVYNSGAVGMFYRAFHTTTESHLERQPYVSGRGNVITWDGRLDNREELERELKEEAFPDGSDVGVIAAAFDRWGTGCFRKFIGDWALAVWSPGEQTLVLARDYIGIRRLYYYATRKKIIWCTYLDPVVLSGDQFDLDDEYIAGYLIMYPKTHLTPYREIYCVPSGAFVSIRNANVGIQPYWGFKPSLRVRYRSDAEYEEHFRHVFRQAIRRRLRANAPIVAELSGGLDSSSIVCMTDHILAEGDVPSSKVSTLSYYDSNDPECDDQQYFSKVEEKRGIAGFHIDLGKCGDVFPIQSTGFAGFPTFRGVGDEYEFGRLDFMRKGGYRVVLSGLGGDEFLGGAPDPLPQFADLIVQMRLVELCKQLKEWSLVKKRPWIQLFLQTLGLLSPQVVGAHLLEQAKVDSWIDGRFSQRLKFSRRQLEPSGRYGFWLPTRQRHAQVLEGLARQITHFPPPSGLYETRYPFLDQNVVEYIVAIPATQLLRPGERRSLMRRALANVLPPEVLARRTKASAGRGYMIALEKQWGELDRLLTVSLTAQLGYVDGEHLRQALRAMKNGKVFSQPVRLLRWPSLELWLRNALAKGVIRVPLRSVPSPSIGTVHSRA